MLIGEYHHTVDQKGRMAIPVKFRSKFENEIVLTLGIDNCLSGYTKEEWSKWVEKMSQLSLGQRDSRAFLRLMLARAVQTEIDGQGRILIPEYLRSYAHLDHKAVVVGIYSRIEIWDEDEWEQYQKNNEEHVGDIAERLSDLGI